MKYFIPILASATFTAGLSARATDPLVTAISSDFSVAITVAALLSSAFAFTHAIVQPVMGPVAERFGKVRLISVCLFMVGIGNIAGFFAPTFELLMASRVICGIGAGGVIPVALAVIADNFPIKERQVAMSRVLAGTLSGALLGVALSGVIADVLGWRYVPLIIGSMVVVSAFSVMFAFRGQHIQKTTITDLPTLMRTYREIFAHPHARICFPAVFIEGVCVQGTFPYISSFVQASGEPRLTIAGIVLAGFAIGGLVYSQTVPYLLRWIGQPKLMMTGGVLVASALIAIGFGPPWQAQLAAMITIGWGFFMLHSSIQTFTTEINTGARAIVTSFHSFSLFTGQMVGPIIYGVALTYFGKMPSLIVGAIGFLCVAVVTSRKLRHPDAI
jgi:MFS transporter, DHA1 family, inner membrane transport protein